jgi:hypothetical protein
MGAVRIFERKLAVVKPVSKFGSKLEKNLA